MRGGNALVVPAPVLSRTQGRFLEKKGFIEIIQKPYPDGKGVYYECPKCGDKFNMYKRLKKHRKEAHAY